VGDWGGGA